MNLFKKLFGKNGTTGFNSPTGISGSSGFGQMGSSGTMGCCTFSFSGVSGSSGTAGTAGIPLGSDVWINLLKNEKNQEMWGGKLRVFDKKGYLLHQNKLIKIITDYEYNIQSFDDNPAVEYSNVANYWFENNKLHRENGPAVVAINGDTTFHFLNDIRLTNEERTNFVRSKRLEEILE